MGLWCKCKIHKFRQEGRLGFCSHDVETIYLVSTSFMFRIEVNSLKKKKKITKVQIT